MRASTKAAIEDRSCVEAINGFTCQLKRDRGACEEIPDRAVKSISEQVAKQLDPVNSFMDAIQHLPFIGALFLKTT